MKNIELKKGYLVDSWNGEIQEVFYATVKYKYYGNDEDSFLVFTKDELMLETISVYSREKIFDTWEKASEHAFTTKLKRVTYYEEENKRNEETIKELKNNLK